MIIKKRKKRKFFCYKNVFLLFLMSAIYFEGITQQLVNGTHATQDYINFLISNLNAESENTIEKENVSLSLSIFILKDEEGELNISRDSILNAVNTLNEYFSPIGITFNILSIKEVENYNYNIFQSEKLIDELTTKHSTTKTINIYLVELININSEIIYGLTYLPDNTNKDYIFLIKSFMNGSTLSQQMGHYFGLLSTHDTVAAIELVNGSNCQNSGDLICDTYADPDLTEKVDTSCHYTGYDMDPFGAFYVPSVANIMSSSLPECRCVFTKGQYKRMLYYYLYHRNYLR